MKYAFCINDQKKWEAEDFQRLPTIILKANRRALLCTECQGMAWFVKESSNGRAAYFSAHHEDDCELKVEWEYTDNELAEQTEEEDTVSAGTDIVVRLDEENGGQLEVTPVMLKPEGMGELGGRTFVRHGQQRESTQQFKLRMLLHRLRQSERFRESTDNITFLTSKENVLISGAIKDVVTYFDDIDVDAPDDEKEHFYWGPISFADKTPDGKIWLNSSTSKKDVSIAIFEDIAGNFTDLFEISDLEQLGGAFVIVAGRRLNATSGKPVIWCGTTNYIFVRKYSKL